MILSREDLVTTCGPSGSTSIRIGATTPPGASEADVRAKLFLRDLDFVLVEHGRTL